VRAAFGGRKGASVYRQYRYHAEEFGISLAVVGNKVTGEDDLLFLKEQVGDHLLTYFQHSSWVRAQEQGRSQGELEPHNIHALCQLRTALDTRTKDWTAFQEHAGALHLRNAAAWADHRQRPLRPGRPRLPARPAVLRTT
jgi:CO dehydrogenase maturation factor